jgi:hypothetical protein
VASQQTTRPGAAGVPQDWIIRAQQHADPWKPSAHEIGDPEHFFGWLGTPSRSLLGGVA